MNRLLLEIQTLKALQVRAENEMRNMVLEHVREQGSFFSGDRKLNKQVSYSYMENRICKNEI